MASSSTHEPLRLEPGEPVLHLEGDDEFPAELRGDGGIVTVQCRRGPGKDQNEDGALVLALGDATLVLAVADGMGGLPHGDVAARRALQVLASRMRGAATGAAAGPALVDAFSEAHGEVQRAAPGGGVTLVAAIVAGSTVQVVHAGDAEALLVGQRGRVKLRTVAHSPIGFAFGLGELDERAALLHEERHIVSNAVGLDPLIVEFGRPVRLGARDTLVLASDGLFDNLLQAEIAAAVRLGPLHVAARRVVEAAARRMAGDPAADLPGKPDDLTVVLFRSCRSGH